MCFESKLDAGVFTRILFDILSASTDSVMCRLRHRLVTIIFVIDATCKLTAAQFSHYMIALRYMACLICAATKFAKKLLNKSYQ